MPPTGAATWRRLIGFLGPAYLVAVGYMDPGNWATDLAAGSGFGYDLLFVVLLSSLAAMLLQSLAGKLGIAAGMDLAQACRERYSPVVRIGLWLVCELAIVACDVAEVIGTAIALDLLFGVPLTWGVCLTGLDVLLILMLQSIGFRALEAFVIALLTIVAFCFAIEIVLVQPSLSGITAGLVPRAAIVTNPAMLYVAIGIVGATVMPHNLYLHSAIVQSRQIGASEQAKREAKRFSNIDTVVALTAAFLVNAAILVLSAAAFHRPGRAPVAEIQQAYHLLSPVLGAASASTLFAIALLASGQNSAVTATLAGQVVMQGFLNMRMPMWKRRLITRLVALVPALTVAATTGVHGTARLLLLTQVVLSLQLPFAVVPLVRLTSDRTVMGVHVNSRALMTCAWLVAAIIIALNISLIASLV